MSDVRFLTVPKLAMLVGVTGRHMLRIVSEEWFPFKPIKRSGKQKRFTDTPQLRQWCKEEKKKRGAAAKIEPPNFFARWAVRFSRFNVGLKKISDDGALTLNEIEYLENLISGAGKTLTAAKKMLREGSIGYLGETLSRPMPVKAVRLPPLSDDRKIIKRLCKAYPHMSRERICELYHINPDALWIRAAVS